MVFREKIFSPQPPTPHWGALRETAPGGFDWQLPFSQWETLKLLIGLKSSTNRPSHFTKFTFFYHQLFHHCSATHHWETLLACTGPAASAGHKLSAPAPCVLLQRVDLCRKAHSNRTKACARRWIHIGRATDALLSLLFYFILKAALCNTECICSPNLLTQRHSNITRR